ncbi:imidazole glycerol phosphate synthase subunit HisH [Brachyspira sp. G79]|uniref:imidazole glycerol phosphate synthase subunit HisH n=1 Tax=Brachyspira sp. G79 TaxID=1358104 RepID=UPI000BBC34C0|nr:imidazole glycerol phosphate synthase subunit HisH [Brachyspira sp. G79]PCG20425.1 imidazole glycerol phosphate synthase [Brachyspira sp. G79]
MVAIIDYGVGNLFSLMSSLNYTDIDNKLTDDENIIKNADAIILPGVGAFRDAIDKLEKKNGGILKHTIMEEAKKGKLILGICLGMQMFFDKSYEYGEYNGLSLINGSICPIDKDLKNKDLKVPHMGWNNLNIKKDDKIFKYINNMEYVYFVHSYYGKYCDDSIIADSEYDVRIPAVVKNDNVYGIQFHPEKSGNTGLNILRGFKDLI